MDLELRSQISIIHITLSNIYPLYGHIVHDHTHFLIPVYPRCQIISQYICQIEFSVDIGCPPLIGIDSFLNKIIGVPYHGLIVLINKTSILNQDIHHPNIVPQTSRVIQRNYSSTMNSLSNDLVSIQLCFLENQILVNYLE